MLIKVQCTGCGAQYRIDSKFAGRSVACKRCQNRIEVPEPEPELREITPLVDDSAHDEHDESEATIQVAYVARRKAQQKKSDDVRAALLPPIVSDALLPLGVVTVAVACLGWVLARWALGSSNISLAFFIIAFATSLFFLAIVKTTMSAVVSAAQTAGMKPPDAVWLQTFALAILPTAGGILGYFGNGIGTCIAGVILGLALMAGTMFLMFPLKPLAYALMLLFTTVWLALSGALAGGTVAFLCWALHATNFTMPWGPPPDTSLASTAPTSKSETIFTAKPIAPIASIQTTSAPPPASHWSIQIDPGIPLETYDVREQSMDLRATIGVIQSTPPGPFIVLVSQNECAIFDLRTGRRHGTINTNFPPARVLLDQSGDYLLAAPAQASGTPDDEFRAPSVTMELFSIAAGKSLGRITTDLPSHGPAAQLGAWFAKDQLATFAYVNDVPTLSVRPLATPTTARSFVCKLTGGVALSPHARYLANTAPGRLVLYDLQKGTVAGEAPIESRWQNTRAIAFSPDGSQLAAVLDDNSMAHVMVWRVADGTMLYSQMANEITPTDWRYSSLFWASDNRNLVFGNAIVNVKSGKVISKINIPNNPDLGGQGKLVQVLWPDEAVFEFRRLGSAGKLAYQIAPLARAEIASALKNLDEPLPPDRIVAHVPLPTTAPVTIVMDPQTPASPSSAPSIPAPTTQRIPLTTLVAQKEWNVTVVSIDTPDPNSLKPQIKDAQADVDRLEQSFEEAEKTLNKVSGEYRTESYFDGLGTRYRKVYNTAGIQAAERDMRNLRDERTDAKYKLAVLQKEEAKLPLRRNVAARLPDDTLCQIEVEGPPLTTTADAMKLNDKITVTGAPRIEDAALHIKPRTLAPAPQ